MGSESAGLSDRGESQEGEIATLPKRCRLHHGGIRMKNILVSGLAVAALGASGVAAADPSEIITPEDGALVYSNTLVLSASDPNVAGAYTGVHWAVVSEGDGPSGNNFAECLGIIHFNRNNQVYDWDYDTGEFESTIDISSLPAGEYCFVFNTVLENPDNGDRIWHYFTVVDDYAKVGGTIQMGGTGRGNSPTHAFDGAIGTVGSSVVGSILVNYREHGEYCSLSPRNSVSIGDTAGGIGVTEPVRANGLFDNSCGGTADVWILGKGNGLEAYPRGAIYIRYTDDGKYDIDVNPDSSDPAENWYPVARGNIEVGERQ